MKEKNFTDSHKRLRKLVMEFRHLNEKEADAWIKKLKKVIANTEL